MAENSFGSRIKSAWNAFMNKDPTVAQSQSSSSIYGSTGYYARPDRHHLGRGIDRSIVNVVYNRISLDIAAIDIRHVRLDSKHGRFLEYVDSDMNECFSTEANIDQTGRDFFQDVAISMMDEGCCAIVPIDTTMDPNKTGSYDIQSMRVGRITQWYPDRVTVNVYNEKTGKKQDVTLSKRIVSIVENPFYSVMNEPNSTMQRLIRKLALLDIVDEQSSSGKLDLIIQLPYTIKSPARKKQANERKKSIEEQLSGSKYGIAYIDSTEKVTQLNRSVENNLLKQVEYLTNLLFSQLGITQGILDGTADEATMTNYYSRTIEPFMSEICEEMKRKFLTKTARSQNQSIEFYRDPFKLVPVGNIAEIADKFTRNEIMTSNEIRSIIGMNPINDPKADMLINSNLNHTPEELEGYSEEGVESEEFQNE